MWPQTEPKEDFERVPKNDTVNMRMLNSRVSVSESINPNLHHGVVRMTNEVII